MQQTEHNEKHVQVPPVNPESQPLQPLPFTQDEESGDPTHLTQAEADEIFRQAEQEIQALLRKMRRDRLFEIAEMVVCFCVVLGAYAGIIYQCITFPHTLVVLYAKEKPASITATLHLPTRTLAPVTITRSQTIPTTGHGHQDARAASGILTFYNGNFSPQSIPVGTVFTGSDGEKMATNEAVTVPAAQPPQFAIARVSTYAVSVGSKSNIAAGDINLALSSDLLVKNLAPFTGGRDARDYTAVARSDIARLTSTVNQTVTEAFTTVFPVRQGEEAIPTTCHTTTTPTHQVGEEAQSVTLSIVKTCSALAYDIKELDQQAARAFTQTRPGTPYRIVGQVQASIVTLSPFTVRVTGAWAFVLTQDDEQLLAEQIAGDTPNQARKVLEQTGVIAYASVPGKLPPAMYIDFSVLVGK